VLLDERFRPRILDILPPKRTQRFFRNKGAVLGNEVALFEYAWRNQLPVLLKGPTGCGKTRFVEHMAARLGRPLYTVSLRASATSSNSLLEESLNG